MNTTLLQQPFFEVTIPIVLAMSSTVWALISTKNRRRDDFRSDLKDIKADLKDVVPAGPTGETIHGVCVPAPIRQPFKSLMNRRLVLRSLGACLLAPQLLPAATPFWNKKAPSEWTPDEIQQLLTRSPWARETNIDFEQSEGGHVELPTGGPPGQDGKPSEAAAGVMRRAPVLVRWESSQAVRDALQLPLLQIFAGRYVISVSNIPPEAMNIGMNLGRRRGDAGLTRPAPTLEEMLTDLQGAATLEVVGRDPAGAGVVRRVPGSESNYLFGFDRDLLTLNGSDKEIAFVLKTARVSVKAKFELKNMLYRGKIAL